MSFKWVEFPSEPVQALIIPRHQHRVEPLGTHTNIGTTVIMDGVEFVVTGFDSEAKKHIIQNVTYGSEKVYLLGYLLL